jgi:hypothetical protein
MAGSLPSRPLTNEIFCVGERNSHLPEKIDVVIEAPIPITADAANDRLRW